MREDTGKEHTQPNVISLWTCAENAENVDHNALSSRARMKQEMSRRASRIGFLRKLTVTEICQLFATVGWYNEKHLSPHCPIGRKSQVIFNFHKIQGASESSWPFSVKAVWFSKK